MTKPKVLIFGPQGSGKGTQGPRFAQAYDLVYLSSGAILRLEILNETPIGRSIQESIGQGFLAPDDLTNDMMIGRLSLPDVQDRGFVLDGYPRTLDQAKALEQVIQPTGALFIDISDAEAERRLTGRLTCHCGASFHIKHLPPKRAGLCDVCDGELYVRHDDQPAAIQQRLALYRSETRPMYDHYSRQGKLYTINGEQSIEKVYSDIIATWQREAIAPTV